MARTIDTVIRDLETHCPISWARDSTPLTEQQWSNFLALINNRILSADHLINLWPNLTSKISKERLFKASHKKKWLVRQLREVVKFTRAGLFEICVTLVNALSTRMVERKLNKPVDLELEKEWFDRQSQKGSSILIRCTTDVNTFEWAQVIYSSSYFREAAKLELFLWRPDAYHFVDNCPLPYYRLSRSYFIQNPSECKDCLTFRYLSTEPFRRRWSIGIGCNAPTGMVPRSSAYEVVFPTAEDWYRHVVDLACWLSVLSTKDESPQILNPLVTIIM